MLIHWNLFYTEIPCTCHIAMYVKTTVKILITFAFGKLRFKPAKHLIWSNKTRILSPLCSLTLKVGENKVASEFRSC